MFNDNLSESLIEGAFIGGVAGTLIAFGIIFVILFALAVYAYFAFAWMTIARKLKFRNPWIAWIPVANLSMILHLGRFHWAWIFLILIPILGWIALIVLGIIATWRIFETRNYPGWFSLSALIPEIGGILYLVAIGFVAWKDKPSGKISHKKPQTSSKAKRKKRR